MPQVQTVDFSKSFLRFRIDAENKPPKTISNQPLYKVNNVRIQINCRCRIIDRDGGSEQTFVMGDSCKTERVGADDNLWTQPNADFVPVFSDDRCLFIKTYARYGMTVELYPPGTGMQSDRQTAVNAETFDRVDLDVADCPADLLETADAVVEAGFSNRQIVARTEWNHERYTAVLEHPVRTINVSERDHIYQTDTGPVLFPDLDRQPDDLIDGMQLAFTAFNAPDWVEFLLRVPTDIGSDAQVYHYSKPLRLTARNQLLMI